MRRFVLVGGGIAGHRAALELGSRAQGASISLVCKEAGLPYDRPPLSKEILLGNKTASEIVLNGASTYMQAGIQHFPGLEVTRIDRDRRLAFARSGERLQYDALLLATGSRPRRLPAAVVGDVRVLYLRTLHDALRLREELTAGRHVTVVGGGFIGLEVAAAAIGRGCRVTVLETRERILARGMPGAASDWIHQLHLNHGVDVRLSTSIAAMRQDRYGVWLDGPGWEMRTDVVVVGIGIEPNVDLATVAGLQVDDGLVVDAQCRTSDPYIFGAGEVTSRPMQIGGRQRIESWRASGEQGAVAAKVMTGADMSFDDVPWLWSDQFDCNIQIIGFLSSASHYEILSGSDSRAWALVCLDEKAVVIGGVTVNRGREASIIRRAVRRGADMSVITSKSSI